jgi:hypothetical protein
VYPGVRWSFDRVPVGRRHDRFACAERVRERPGNYLSLMAIRGNVNVRGADELDHFVWTDETVVEDHIRLHSHFLCQSLQACSIIVTLTSKNMQVG